MNDLIGNETDDNEVVDESTTEAAETTTKVDDIKKEYFPSAKLADAQVAIEKATTIAADHGLEVVFNFDTEKDFPAGYGISIFPIAKRINNVNQTIGVAIGAVPDLATVQQHENGQQYITDSVIGSMVAKLANAVRPRNADGDTASSIPFSVDDFITSNRPEGVLLAFREFAGTYVKVLKKKGLTFMTESILRQTLQSAAFAAQHVPNVPQDKWVQIIDSMIARAEAAGIAVGMLAEWKETRDSATLKDAAVDLSDLDFSDDADE